MRREGRKGKKEREGKKGGKERKGKKIPPHNCPFVVW